MLAVVVAEKVLVLVVAVVLAAVEVMVVPALLVAPLVKTVSGIAIRTVIPMFRKPLLRGASSSAARRNRVECDLKKHIGFRVEGALKVVKPSE